METQPVRKNIAHPRIQKAIAPGAVRLDPRVLGAPLHGFFCTTKFKLTPR
jgi:hypothetical protein